MRFCIIIPVYNHELAIPVLLARLKNYGIPTILVNDGSSEVCSQILADCVEPESSWLCFITRLENGGKGAAMLDGFNAAYALGFSHALQIDADGQHDINDIPVFLETSRQQPEALILGQPIFDTSVPKGRLYGRRFTNLWIAINTLSFSMADGMCGFRVYPLAAVEKLTAMSQIARRMDFDIDILVRLYWQGLTMINIPTSVHYPVDGVSHFRLWQDNVRISRAHAQLFLGMLTRIPQLLKRHRS
jgi:glycosyltransferase involved in cell wall biosynthesis